MEGIEIRRIDASYNGVSPFTSLMALVLSNISLTIEKGEFLGIIGPNGAGKSTLLKVMSGILSSYQGEVLINGKKLQEYKRKELAQLLGVVPQQSFLAYRLSV